MANGDTRRGYHEWVAHQRAADEDFEELCGVLGLGTGPVARPDR